MKSARKPDRSGGGNHGRQPQAPAVARGSPKLKGVEVFAVVFGLFLGLALIKFGNPAIFEAKIAPPKSFSQFLGYAWPPSWSIWLLGPLTLAGAVLAVTGPTRWRSTRWLWILPAVWFGWQLVSATHTVDWPLTATTLWHFAGCVACYFAGACVLGDERRLRLLLIGLLAGFAFCLVRAAEEKLFEFPQEHQMLVEAERTGWTNLPPELVVEMKQDGVIIRTNGVDIANPVILAKYAKGRVHGTLIYPNALAGIDLLLLPVALGLALTATRRFRTVTRIAVIALTLFLGFGSLFWTGSKSGWLIALGLGAVFLFRLRWPMRAKWLTLVLVIVAGLAAFGLRFHRYFESGATSVGARFDYWRAAVQITSNHLVFGTGPGTFQRPYELIKSPHAEMARLAHNDYLEQFSDSGIVGGSIYVLWIGLLLVILAKRVWRLPQTLCFTLFLGLLGWFIQGFTEFSLYVPALAWTAFCLAGCLLEVTGKSVRQADG